jgi:hypothetical protein
MARQQRELECDTHLVPIDPRDGCPYCVRFVEAAPDPEKMSRDERLEELERWLLSQRSLPQDLFYRRVELLVGRPVGAYELEDPDMLMRRAMRPRRRDDWW